MNKILRLLFIIATVVVLPITDVWSASYQIIDIGQFNGVVSGINNSGVLTGTVVLSTYTAFTWSSYSGFRYLSPLSGYEMSFADAINNSGQVAGTSESYVPDGCRASLWNDGESADNIGTFAAKDINNAGQVVGGSYLWSEGTGSQYIGDISATAINDNGMIVGQNYSQALVWKPCVGMDVIDISVSDMLTTAVDINNAGQVIVQAYSWSTLGSAYLWQDNNVISLGMLPRSDYTSAYDINNAGQVVGKSGGQAFVWDSTNGIQALPLNSGFSSGTASAINDSGIIAGCAYDALGNSHLVVWTPVPEPSSVLALVSGVVGFGGLVLKRKRHSI
jgi:uncharacterized membrane protein